VSRFRHILGAQPELRIIAALLLVIVVLLILILLKVSEIERGTPYICGDSISPCEVHIAN